MSVNSIQSTTPIPQTAAPAAPAPQSKPEAAQSQMAADIENVQGARAGRNPILALQPLAGPWEQVAGAADQAARGLFEFSG